MAKIEYPIALQQVSEDKKWRLTVSYDEDAKHPLFWCDFPLHMDDWNREYSANPTRWHRDPSKREHYDSREECMRYLVNSFGDRKKIVDRLVANGKKQSHECYDEALIYDRSRREWLLMSWMPGWSTYTGERMPAHWGGEESFCCKREELDVYSLTYNMGGEALADLIEHCLTDKVKVMSYTFGYHGSMSFCANVYPTCDGLAWLEKSEAVGDGKWLTEEQWNTKDCYQLSEGEREEIEAWADGDCYSFEVEKNVRWKVHRECLSEKRADEDYEQEEWEHVDSCSGFYGLDYAVQYAVSVNALPKMIDAA